MENQILNSDQFVSVEQVTVWQKGKFHSKSTLPLRILQVAQKGFSRLYYDYGLYYTCIKAYKIFLFQPGQRYVNDPQLQTMTNPTWGQEELLSASFIILSLNSSFCLCNCGNTECYTFVTQFIKHSTCLSYFHLDCMPLCMSCCNKTFTKVYSKYIGWFMVEKVCGQHRKGYAYINTRWKLYMLAHRLEVFYTQSNT